MDMQQTPVPQPPARMSQGRLIVTIAAGIVLAVIALALLPFLLLGGLVAVAVLAGFVIHLIAAIVPLVIIGAVLVAFVRWARRRA